MSTSTSTAVEATAAPAEGSFSLSPWEERQRLHEMVTRGDCVEGLQSALQLCGAFFNENKVLEHTCTTATLPAYTNAIDKVQYLERPPDVPRAMQVGADRKNLPRFRVVDGTNLSETSGGEVEKPLAQNGGFNKKKWQGKAMGKVGRMNERARVSLHNGHSLKHYELSTARAYKALMLSRGQPDPHPSLPLLAPRSKAQHGTDYFDSELERKAERQRQQGAAPAASALAAPSTAPPPPPFSEPEAAPPTASALASTPLAVPIPPAVQIPPQVPSTHPLHSMPTAAAPEPLAARKREAEAKLNKLKRSRLVTTLPIFDDSAAVLLREPDGMSYKELARGPDNRGPAPAKLRVGAAVGAAGSSSFTGLDANGDIFGTAAHHVTRGRGVAYQVGYSLRNVTASCPKLCKCKDEKCKTKPVGGHLAGCEHKLIWDYRGVHRLTQK